VGEELVDDGSKRLLVIGGDLGDGPAVKANPDR
jgi:hypothetical protein